MRERLLRLEAWCQTNRPEYLQALAPPAAESELAKLKQRFEDVPEALLDLFRWHNGTKENQTQAFIHNFALMSVQECVDAIDGFNAMNAAEAFEEKYWWRPKWIPFLESWGGDHLCLDLEGVFFGRAGQVIEFWHDDDCRSVLAPTFETWFDCFVEALEASLFSVEEGDLEADDAYDDFCEQKLEGYPIEGKSDGDVL